MNGAESLVRTLLASGVDTCFANPGTSEMHFCAALDRVPGMRCVLALFEGVATGAADGFARMAGRPAATLLHCGPGLANGLANLHNARRAGTAVVNCVGDQATHHRPLDPPLAADTAGFARGVSAWVHTSTTAAGVGADAALAVQAARRGHGQVATLILPSDTCWNAGGVPAEPLPAERPGRVDQRAIERAAATLREAPGALLLLGGPALHEAGLAQAARIAAATGARVLGEQFVARMARGRGRPAVSRVPYPLDAALAALADVRRAVLVGAPPPVGFFAYPGRPGALLPADAAVQVLATPQDDCVAALAALADALGAPPGVPALPPAAPASPEPVRGAPSGPALAAALAQLLPEGAVVIDEALSLRADLFHGLTHAAPHDWLEVPGGAIGGGLPLAAGAAIGAPGRRVVALQADGSGMYTPQALWTMARERLDVTVVLLANRRYAVLLHELAGVDAEPGPTVLDMMHLDRPALDWVALAAGMGVEAARAETMERFADLFAASLGRAGPFLIELVLP